MRYAWTLELILVGAANCGSVRARALGRRGQRTICVEFSRQYVGVPRFPVFFFCEVDGNECDGFLSLVR